MTTVVFVPGTMGSELVDQQQRVVWPPGRTPKPIDPEELVRILLDRNIRVGDVIGHAPCAGEIYDPLLTHLAALQVDVVPFAYDWRRDIRTIAAALAQRIGDIAGTDSIALVAHSMGGLVVRWLLESGAYANEPWFTRIDRAVFAATPHFGAPLALFRILGLDGIPIVVPGWAFKLLSADPQEYPSGFQLLPAPGIDCVTRPSQPSLTVYEGFPVLDRTGTSAATQLHDVLDRFVRPDSVIYTAAYGTGHDTVAGIRLATQTPEESPGDGDGTVPAWSGNPTTHSSAARRAFSAVEPFIADHVGLVGNQRFLAELTGWLGLNIA